MTAATQQINLYQPVADAGAVPFSFSTAVLLVSCVAAGLVSVWAYGLWRVQHLERAVSQLRQQQEHQTQTLATLTAARAEGVSPEQLETRAQMLSAQLAAHSSALALVRNGAIGRTTGFSGRLTALARHPIGGLWVTRIALSGVGEPKLSVAGVALEPDLVPRYLQALGTEPALTGLRFEDFTIERPSHEGAAAGPESGFVFKADSNGGTAAAGDHQS